MRNMYTIRFENEFEEEWSEIELQERIDESRIDVVEDCYYQ